MSNKNNLRNIVLAGSFAAALGTAQAKDLDFTHEVKVNGPIYDSIISDTNLMADISSCYTKGVEDPVEELIVQNNLEGLTSGNIKFSFNEDELGLVDCNSLVVKTDKPSLESKITESNTSNQTSTQRTPVKYSFCEAPITNDLVNINGKVHEIPECDKNRRGTAGDQVKSLLTSGQYTLNDSGVYSANEIGKIIDESRNRKQDNFVISSFVPTQNNQETPTIQVRNFTESVVPPRIQNMEGILFDINGDGIVDSINLKNSDEGNVVAELVDGSTNEVSYHTVDSLRNRVLANTRFNNVNNSVGAASCYNMSFGSQGEEVVRFMNQSNRYATDLVENGTKFPNLEEFGVFIDTVANCNVRAKELLTQSDEGINLNSENAQAYRMTFGQSVPGQILALQMGLGSALFATYSSDFNPAVQANQAMVTARNGATAMNLKSLEQELSVTGELRESPLSAYQNSQRMYDAQFKSSRQKLSQEVKF